MKNHGLSLRSTALPPCVRHNKRTNGARHAHRVPSRHARTHARTQGKQASKHKRTRLPTVRSPAARTDGRRSPLRRTDRSAWTKLRTFIKTINTASMFIHSGRAKARARLLVGSRQLGCCTRTATLRGGLASACTCVPMTERKLARGKAELRRHAQHHTLRARRVEQRDDLVGIHRKQVDETCRCWLLLRQSSKSSSLRHLRAVVGDGLACTNG